MPLPPFVCCIAVVTLCYFVPMAIIVNIICWHGKPFCPLPSLSLDCWVRISVWIGGNEMAPPPLPIAHCATWSDVPVCPARPVHPARSVGVNWRRLGPCPVTDGRCGVCGDLPSCRALEHPRWKTMKMATWYIAMATFSKTDVREYNYFVVDILIDNIISPDITPVPWGEQYSHVFLS